MTDYPPDILTTAQSIVAAISSRMEPSSTLGAAATEVIAEALMAERARLGGARSIKLRGKLVIIHPDMPPHVWDGKEMRQVDFSEPGAEYAIHEGYMFFAGVRP